MSVESREGKVDAARTKKFWWEGGMPAAYFSPNWNRLRFLVLRLVLPFPLSGLLHFCLLGYYVCHPSALNICGWDNMRLAAYSSYFLGPGG